jgi:hypothetical protein
MVVFWVKSRRTMRRPLLTIVLSASFLGVMTVAAFGGGAGDRVPAAPWFLSAESSATVAAVEADESVPGRDPIEPDQQPVLFDSLRAGIVGVVVLLLVVRNAAPGGGLAPRARGTPEIPERIPFERCIDR